ncbi:MAG: hypothetical protein AAF235_02250, partial [Planctomycetota bacterium]
MPSHTMPRHQHYNQHPRATAVILARGGSKGLPRKNLADVAGRPCVAWTIDHAAHSASISRIILSSDDLDILAVGAEAGVELHHRSAATASDNAAVDVALREALQDTSPRTRQPASPVVLLYGNVPVRPHDLTDRAVRLLEESNADSVQSFAAVGKHHPLWTARIDPDSGSISPYEGTRLFGGVFRRQDLPPVFIPDGGVVALAGRGMHAAATEHDPSDPHAFLGRDRRAIETREGDVI